ncbi:MAG: hypothetical protein KDB37_06005 [Ilumatobacter sp.]|nr:hypothetical protein [Ilumatobacter sp.]
MFRRMRQGWELTKKSWGVIREHPKLLRLPLVGGVLALIAVALIAGPGLFLVASDSAETSDDLLVYLGYGLIALGSFVASCIVIYYNVILAAAADQALQGREPDIAAAKAIAGRRRGTIIGWAIVSAIVSLVFSLIRDKGGAVGNILGSIGAAAWGFVTFLVIPVIALEDIGPIDAVKRSGNLVKQRWGQQATGNVVIGGIASIAMFIGIALGVLGGVLIVAGGVAATSGGIGLVVVGIVIAVMAGLAAGATKGVFGVALYHFSAEHRALGPFSETELAHAAG